MCCVVHILLPVYLSIVLHVCVHNLQFIIPVLMLYSGLCDFFLVMNVIARVQDRHERTCQFRHNAISV